MNYLQKLLKINAKKLDFILILILSLFQQLRYKQFKTKKMKATTEHTKNVVIAKLISWGNNEETVKDMVEKHFRYAFEHYATVKTIAECIKTIY